MTLPILPRSGRALNEHEYDFNSSFFHINPKEYVYNNHIKLTAFLTQNRNSKKINLIYIMLIPPGRNHKKAFEHKHSGLKNIGKPRIRW